MERFVIFSSKLGFLTHGWGPSFSKNSDVAIKFWGQDKVHEKLRELWKGGFDDCFSVPEESIWAYDTKCPYCHCEMDATEKQVHGICKACEMSF